MPEIRDARSSELVFTLVWETDSGSLKGELVAINVCEHVVRVSGKPRLIPIGIDGEPLDADTIVSLEMKVPGHVDLGPGERAAASVLWAGWDGPPASSRVVVGWRGGRQEVEASGPRQPESPGPPTNISTSWFELVR
jgi:hypothetical protein